jgi:uncharacterized protein (DUF4415 family)
MKTMTLDEVKRLPPLTEEEVNAVKNFKNTNFSDCAVQTKEELKKFKPWYEVHPNGNDIYKVTVKKTSVQIRIDNDVLEALKAKGKGYQTRINDILRQAVLG